ncbi:MAG: 2-amino-4-oxopentanoate thiolase subunit OrtB [Saccharofermentanales bacterium]|jgi:cysteine synthase|nr:2-amino-4-oxopentanoate thiolase subunit OrtB [Bacillota bacterium]NLB09430.1 PLP-dependent lyase/thiolase [Clostridiales bacterium]
MPGKDMSYAAVMGRRSEIMLSAVGIDYDKYELEGVAFDYEKMMSDVGYSMDEVRAIQKSMDVGNTPLLELKNFSALAAKIGGPGKGARIFVKDEAGNPSGSFKARRAALAVHEAKKLGYKGVIAATSGNYGAAVACMAAKLGLKCIIVQECYDSKFVGQPEILEKQRACEALGAEVVQMTVGPELFYEDLRLLEVTGFYNASLYVPAAITGVETLGYEIVEQTRALLGKDPDYVLVTNAGGGNLTGTARGVKKAGAKDTKIYAVSVDLSGLHMASDGDFNRKSFTTGHTGFGIPFTTLPDRCDVPRNAARPLRYIDEYLLVKQGEVFYVTEMLAALEGIERGPAGNTSLAAAVALASTLPKDNVIVVQETEYTGAGKHPMPQLTFARQNGVEIKFGDPDDDVPGKNIILPSDPSKIKLRFNDMKRLRLSNLKNIAKEDREYSAVELQYMADETGVTVDEVKELLAELKK